MVITSLLDIENMNQTRHNMIFFLISDGFFSFDLSIKFDISNSLSKLRCFKSHNMIKFVHELKYGVGGVIVKYLYQELFVSTQENP